MNPWATAIDDFDSWLKFNGCYERRVSACYSIAADYGGLIDESNGEYDPKKPKSEHVIL